MNEITKEAGMFLAQGTLAASAIVICCAGHILEGVAFLFVIGIVERYAPAGSC